MEETSQADSGSAAAGDEFLATEVRAFQPGEEKAAADHLGDLFRAPQTFFQMGTWGRRG